MSFFEKFPEFIEVDSRKDREWSPHNVETLDGRHEVALPKSVVEGCKVLDLGSCFGATGQWVLSHGATHYTGVEVQPEMVKTSREILSKYWNENQFEIVQSDIRDFLKKKIEENVQYDVVVVIGVIYAFLDTQGLLELITKVTKDVVVIDCLYPFWMLGAEVSIIDVIREQHINSENMNSAFAGAGARPSPAALQILMETHNFVSPEGLLYPKPLSDSNIHDPYNTLLERPWIGIRHYKTPGRYLMRFVRTEKTNTVEVGKYVANNDEKGKSDFGPPPEFIPTKSWEFDSEVAARFQDEAEKHIPDYQRVINMCLSFVKIAYPPKYTDPEKLYNLKIIDVGSALGHTMDKFISNGFKNVYGVDNSSAMISMSKYPDRVFLNNKFPIDQKWDIVLANWTLHFIQEREQYLRDIYNSMNTGGILILSDKMSHDDIVEKFYYRFKETNGVPWDVIEKKKAALNGVLVTKPLQWYLDTLKSLKFTDIQVVNNRFMFSTIYARKI